MSEFLKTPTAGLLQSPLHAFGLPGKTRAATPDDGVVASELPHLGYIVIRGKADDEAFMGNAAAVLGQSLPTAPMTVAACPAGALLWISPDEWLLACKRSRRDLLLALLVTAMKGVHAQVVDNSGGLTAMRLSGPQHVMLLRHLGTYDFESLIVGRGVSTVIQKTTITVARTDADGLMLVFRRSFADYTWRLIERSARPYRLCVATPQSHADPVFAPLLETA